MITFKEFTVVDYTAMQQEKPEADPDGLLARYYAKRMKLRAMDEDVEDEDELEEVNEALTLQQRIQRRMIFRKNRAKIKLGQERSKRRHATRDVLMNRAIKMARDMMARKLLQGKSKGEVSFAERSRVEKILAKRKNGIKRLAVKLLPKVRERESKKFEAKPKSESTPEKKKE